jgi:hypothetical protein
MPLTVQILHEIDYSESIPKSNITIQFFKKMNFTD